MKPTRLYRAVKWIISRALRVYFSRITMDGIENIPADKPYILAVNHQNALLDPLLIGTLFPKAIYFLTRSDVFTAKTQKWLFQLNMMPIYRMKNGIGNLEKNQVIFKKCKDLFEAGESVMIFPEGNHGEPHYLRPLSKGTARLALESQSQMTNDLYILPVGLNYFEQKTPRTRVSIVYGKPISVRDHLAKFQDDHQKGFKALKDDLSVAMKECMVIPEKTDDYELKVKKVLHSRNEGLSFKKLRELAAKDYSKAALEFVDIPKTSGQRFAIKAANLPNWGPYLLLDHILKKFKDRVFYGTIKFAVMLMAMPIWWLLALAFGWIFFGFWEGVVLIVLSVVGLFAKAELTKN
jgi:1-acyl-sn-glycerol-3-phosphate acyltransferase